MKLVVSLALIVASGTLHAAEWTRVGENDTSAMYVDLSSLRRTGDRVKAWEKMVLSYPAEAVRDPTKTYQSAMALTVYDCAAKTLAYSQVIRYAHADGGGVVESVTLRANELEFTEMPPETLGAVALDLVCEKSASSKK